MLQRDDVRDDSHCICSLELLIFFQQQLRRRKRWRKLNQEWRKKLLRKSQLKIRLNERKGLAGVCVERAAAQKSSLKGISGCHAKFYSFTKSYPLWTPKWLYGLKSFQGVFYSVPDYNTILDADVNLNGFTANNSSIQYMHFFPFFFFFFLFL